MDINIELKNTKIIISWADVKADCYKIFFKKGDMLIQDHSKGGELTQ